MFPILSIIIPIHNGEPFLKKLNATISAFTFTDFECIFIDNNSTDNSISVLKELLKSSSFDYQILSESNQGAGHARNTGIKHSKGEYLAFLDCDDVILPEKFEYDFKILEEHDLDFVFCRAQRFYEDGRILNHPITEINVGMNYPPQLGLIWLKNYFTLQGPGSLVVKKSVVEKLGGFHTSLTGEDAFLFIKLGLEYKGYFYKKILFHYLRHKNSTISMSNKVDNGAVERYFELRKNLYIDPVIQQHSFAIHILKEQLQMDILRLHNGGKSFSSLKSDEKLAEMNFSKVLFNPASLFFNWYVPNIKYNPFFQIDRKVLRNWRNNKISLEMKKL